MLLEYLVNLKKTNIVSCRSLVGFKRKYVSAYFDCDCDCDCDCVCDCHCNPYE